MAAKPWAPIVLVIVATAVAVGIRLDMALIGTSGLVMFLPSSPPRYLAGRRWAYLALLLNAVLIWFLIPLEFWRRPSLHELHRSRR